ncbi:MAG: insulinase family protein [Myxococcales bacterium]|nr:insulinase family protein [Myxococcales bacterium]MCB9707166.1 insulinase family protein [Myxococcales bacterium]
MMRALFLFAWLFGLMACASNAPLPRATPTPRHRAAARVSSHAQSVPPTSAAPKDIKFPAIQRTSLTNGLETNIVVLPDLPVVYVHLVIRSGEATDPKGLPGVAHLTANLLKEGTRHLSSAKFAEAVEFYGAKFTVGSDADHVYLTMQTLREHLDPTLKLLAEVVTEPALENEELKKLKRRERARLDLQSQDPYFLASRQLRKVLYGDHPYAQIDTTPEALNKVSRQDLAQWHERHVLPNNAFLVAAGKIEAASFNTLADKAFKRWRKGNLTQQSLSRPEYSQNRHVFLVDRPNSVQSVIYWGNLALRRRDAHYIPLMVANQVLGGSAASRLFMDLREKRSLTYGAYSRVGVSAQTSVFRASAAVRTDVTAEALDAFSRHLRHIRDEAPSKEELTHAKQYLSDSFPMHIETVGSIVDLVAELRLYGLPDGYWDQYRSAIRSVSGTEALSAARAYITPSKSVIVVVGKAADIAEPLRRFGPVTVVDTGGNVIKTMPADPRS